MHVPVPRTLPGRWLAAIATLSILAASGDPAQGVDYDFASISSIGAALPQFTATVPSVNSAGTAAFADLVFDPIDNRNEYIVFRSDGAGRVAVLNLTDALGVGSPSSLVINDAGAIAVNYSLGAQAAIVRINGDGSFIVLAQADRLGSAPYLEFPTTISMNGAGQVAALVTNSDSTSSIVRLDDRGAIEIARSSPELFDFSSPTINDAGIVAFTARALSAAEVSVYTGAGGPLTNEGSAGPCAGSAAHTPVINNEGFVLSDCGTPLLFTARAGLLTVRLAGTEHPIFARLASSYSLNNRGLPAFVTTTPSDASTEVGLFTGNDPLNSKVVRTGDVVFGLTVNDIRMGYHAINDGGQIAFLLQVGDGANATSHVILATPRRISQTIDFAAPGNRRLGDPPFVVIATASSGLPVTFAGAGACSVAGSTVILLGAGACTITASQSGDATYLPAADVSQTFGLGRAGQAIAFGSLPDRTFGDLTFTISATTSSGLPPTFFAAGVCSVANDLVTIAAIGSCAVTASQAGNLNYEPAPDVVRTFAIARASQIITFVPLPDRTFGSPAFTVSATVSSGFPVIFSATGACTIAGDVVTPNAAGSCTVIAAQPGNDNYAPAPEVAQTFAIARAAQAITFVALPDRTFGDPPFAVSATAVSGLSVIFNVTGSCSLARDVLTITAGTCTVTASQPGDTNYAPAPDVPRTFVIARARQSITFDPLANRRLGGPPFAVSAAASSTLAVSFTATGSCSMTADTVIPTGGGFCTITAAQAGSADFDAASPVARTFWTSGVILEARFDAGPDGFTYVDDAFRGTSQPGYARGDWISFGGFRGGALKVNLDGIDNNLISGISGGWQTTFSLNAPTKVMLYVRSSLTQAADYLIDEKSQLLVSVDGVLIGPAPNDYVAQITGDGRGGISRTTGWRLYPVSLGTLGAGTHTLVVGGYNNKKTAATETTTILIDDVLLTDTISGARAAVATLDFDRFKETIRILSDYGDRTQGSASYTNASIWLENQLQAAGYAVQHHAYTYLGQPRTSIYVTKVGTQYPDQMYIVSAHLDGRGGGGAANDNASGCSLVLEAARALAGMQTAASVRFIFWNNEETGLNGSTAYANERVKQQGLENPPGSGLYPEPRWLGMIQHDQILYDHGLPPQPDQIPGADLDVEYQASSTYATQSLQLATALQAGNQTHSTNYPAQIGSNMNYTDSVPFQNYTATVSVRDDQRVAEIGNGSNPHWHQPTDLYRTYSEADFRLGLNAVQMTLGTVAELAGAMIVP